jgi:predicted lipoprotein with Yx(FWY)xxD motif
MDLASTPADATITGSSDGPLTVGDVDGDGRADIVVGNGSEVAVIRGGMLPASQTLAAAATAHLTGVNATVLYTFDWNGDGQAEIVIGDAFNNRTLVIFGGARAGAYNLVDRANWIITGEQAADQFGYAVSSGDLDADGMADLIIGSRSHTLSTRSDPHFNDAGAVYVFYGAAGLGSSPVPLSGVSTSGPTEGTVNAAYVFTATASPVTATLPITFTWQASGQAPVTHTGNGLSDWVTYTWPLQEAGQQIITATAMNATSVVTDIHTLTIAAHRIYLPLLIK